MNLSPDTEQLELLSATTDWCRDHIPLGQARARPAGLSRELRSMGWLEMTVPATTGGLGVSHATETLVFAELGRFLAPVSALATAITHRWAALSGAVSMAVAADVTWRVFDPASASHALVADHGAVRLTALPRDLAAREGLDPLTPVAMIAAPGDTSSLAPSAHLHLQLLSGAYAVGCADAARDMAADYARVREQFDRPIGWFQSVKHLCADMAVRSAVARSQLYYAACAMDAGDTDAAFHIAAAKRLADQAALDNARNNIQIHGGIGMTDAADPHLCLKRAHLLAFIAPCHRTDLLGGSE